MVHIIFTAAVIHLLDFVHTEEPMRNKAKHRFLICIKGMEEMNETWAWSGRCLRSIKSLVKEWNVNISLNVLEGTENTSGSASHHQKSKLSADAALGDDQLWDSFESTQGMRGTLPEGRLNSDASWTDIGAAGLLDGVIFDLPVADQFDANFVDHWWEDASM